MDASVCHYQLGEELLIVVLLQNLHCPPPLPHTHTTNSPVPTTAGFPSQGPGYLMRSLLDIS